MNYSGSSKYKLPQIARQDFWFFCLSVCCICPATTQTAHSTLEAAYGELHRLEEIQWEATVHRTDYALPRLTACIYIYVLKPFCATRSFQHIMPLLKAHYYTQRVSQKILQLRGSLGPSAGN